MASSILRRLLRASRDHPLLGGAARSVDRVWWWRSVLRSGLVDAEFYAAQLGRRSIGARRAAWHYVSAGWRRGFSVSPLVDELVLGAGLPEASRVPAMYAYLLSDRRTVRVHPWWDPAPADDEPALERAWRLRDSAEVTLRFGSHAVAIPVETVRRWAIDAARGIDHDIPASDAELDVSIIRLLQRQDRRYPAKVAAAHGATGSEVVVVSIDASPSQRVALAILHRMDVRDLTVVQLATASFGEAVAAGAAVGVGRVVVTVDPAVEASAEQLTELAAAVAPSSPVAPVTLAPDGTIDNVGAAVVGGRVCRLLESLPAEDLRGLGRDPIEVPLLTGRTFAILAVDLLEAGGLDPTPHDGELELLIDRWSRPGARPTPRVLPTVVFGRFTPGEAFGGRSLARAAFDRDDAAAAEALLAAAGFEVRAWDVSGARATPHLRRDPAARPRWAIKVSSPAGPAGDVWGDTHFAIGLANALRRRGVDAVVDAFEARDRVTSYLDDVTLVVRGPYRIAPPAHGTRIEWIISHPDQITAEEVGDFDLVFAASRRWAASASRELGTTVEPLLECTDADQFFPRGLERDGDIVFVGTSRGIARPSVVAPLRAGVPVRVYGPDWRGFIPADAIAAASIPNSRLSERYESAAVVLNDHWPAMRREGFMAMRPFDAVAAGGRVISEEVDELADLFRGAVVTYRDEAELVDLLRRDLDSLFPADGDLAAIGEYIRREHSFDARAGELIDAVNRLASGRGSTLAG